MKTLHFASRTRCPSIQCKDHSGVKPRRAFHAREGYAGPPCPPYRVTRLTVTGSRVSLRQSVSVKMSLPDSKTLVFCLVETASQHPSLRQSKLDSFAKTIVKKAALSKKSKNKLNLRELKSHLKTEENIDISKVTNHATHQITLSNQGDSNDVN